MTATLAITVFVATVLSDAAIGALIAGIFSVVNTMLTAHLVREQRNLRRTIAAPRTMVYDVDGRPIGTVLELRTGEATTEERAS